MESLRAENNMINRKKQSGNSIIFVILALLLLILGGAYFLSKKSFQTGTGAPNIKVKDSSTTLSENDVNNVNVDEIDNDVDGVESEAEDLSPSPVQKTEAPRIRLKNGNSSNWSGYAVETNLTSPTNNAVSDVKGSWVVPTVTCDPTINTYSSAWVGIDGYSDGSVEQIGTEQDCISGQPRYYAWYEMYPKPSRYIMPVSPGQNISAEVTYVNGRFVLKLNGFSTTQKANAQRQSAEWIMEAPWSGGVLPLANFGTINFGGSQATLNGVTGTINNSSWQNDKITMVNSSGSPKATPSSLSSDGSSFSVTWNSSN